MSDKRLILALSIDSLPEEFLQTGFHAISDFEMVDILEDAEAWFGPRDILETFDAYRQVIPYVIVVVGDKIVSYTRMPKGGESRLHGKVSFGLGGHVDLPDAMLDDKERFDIINTLVAATERELDEELIGWAVAEYPTPQPVGLLVENATEVDRVHIGVVSVMRLDEAPTSGEDEIGEVELLTIEELTERADRLENWSKVLLPHLKDLVAA